MAESAERKAYKHRWMQDYRKVEVKRRHKISAIVLATAEALASQSSDVAKALAEYRDFEESVGK